MLLTIYENTNPVSFNQDFTENIILPRNANLKLLSAYCNRNPKVVILNTDTINLIANDKAWGGATKTLTAGNYYGQDLANHIKALLNEINTENSLELDVVVNFDITKNWGVDALTIDLRCLSLYYNRVSLVLFENAVAPETDWGAFTTDKNAVITTYTLDKVNTYGVSYSNELGCEELEDALGADLEDMRNYYYFDKEKIHQKWYSPNTDEEDRPVSNIPYGVCAFTVEDGLVDSLGGDTNQTFWVGISSSAPDISNITGATLNDFQTGIKSVDALMIFCGETLPLTASPDTQVNAGDIVIMFLDRTTNPPSYSPPKFYTDIQEGSEFCFVLKDDANSPQQIEIYLKFAGDWTHLETSPYNMVAGSNYSVCGGFRNKRNGTTNQIADLEISSKQGYDYMANMGQYIKLNMSNDLATKMGFSHNPYTADTTGTPNKAELIVKNFKEATTQSANVNEPYVCVNVNNLSVKSYTERDTEQGAGFNGVSSSKTIGVISRFDNSGGFNGHLVDVGNNHSTIQLHNSEELTISQFNMRLTNINGSVPLDLAPPFGAVLEITEGK